MLGGSGGVEKLCGAKPQNTLHISTISEGVFDWVGTGYGVGEPRATEDHTAQPTHVELIFKEIALKFLFFFSNFSRLGNESYYRNHFYYKQESEDIICHLQSLFHLWPGVQRKILPIAFLKELWLSNRFSDIPWNTCGVHANQLFLQQQKHLQHTGPLRFSKTVYLSSQFDRNCLDALWQASEMARERGLILRPAREHQDKTTDIAALVHPSGTKATPT
eukprot:gene24838-biopygen2189